MFGCGLDLKSSACTQGTISILVSGMVGRFKELSSFISPAYLDGFAVRCTGQQLNSRVEWVDLTALFSFCDDGTNNIEETAAIIYDITSGHVVFFGVV